MHKPYTLLAGTMPQDVRPLPPFSPLVLDFLQALSQRLRHTPLPADETAWAALRFWLRPSHLNTLAAGVSLRRQRLGRGLIFHIAPANMPAMFAYSLCISLLAGNGNIVRLPARLAARSQAVCAILQELWTRPEFFPLGQANAILTYDHDKALTDALSRQCDGRIIWGGDAAIAAVRLSPLPPQAVELVFADRYSLSVFHTASLAAESSEGLRELAHRFYNDTYEADQNACSSPRLLCWIGNAHTAVQRRWWQAVAAESKAYELQPIKVSAKYTDAWHFAMTVPQLQSVQRWDNRLYVYTLSSLPPDITQLSGPFGQFFQCQLPAVSDLLPYLQKKVQTITAYGIDTAAFRQLLIDGGVRGGDRIVAVGQALEMSIRWDGCNMIESLSRILD